MTEKKKFKSYVKGFGRGFLLFALTEPENRPTKEDNKYRYNGYVSGAIIGAPVWIPVTYFAMIGYGLFSCPGACYDSYKEHRSEQEAWERKRYSR